MGYGLVGGVFVALLGNLASAFQVGWSQGLAPAREALRGGLSGFGERLGSWFVGPSRVIEIPDKLLTINEFPFWSYLFAEGAINPDPVIDGTRVYVAHGEVNPAGGRQGRGRRRARPPTPGRSTRYRSSGRCGTA